jgi:hypothetical protein
MKDFNQLLGGGEIPVRDLLAINDALRKSTTAGYQTPSSGGGNIGPLMPQSIQNTLDIATFTMKHIRFWPKLVKESIAQTLHEFVTVEDHGDPLDPFIPEGGGGTTNKATYDKDTVRVKYLADRRQVTDVASMVGIIGANPNAVAEETQRGTLSLLGKLEWQLFYGDSTANDLAFDGVITQVKSKAPNNVSDLRGSVPTPKDLQRVLGELFSEPRYGMVEEICVEPRVFSSLIEYANQFGRHDQMRREMGVITYGSDKLQITAPYGPVPVVPMPFMHRGRKVPAAATSYGDSPPNISAAVITETAASSGDSKFTAADAGDYYYVFVGVSTATKGGNSARKASAAVTVAAGEHVTLTIQNSTGVDYWRLYRSPKDGTADDAQFIGQFAINVLGGAGVTQLVDNNDIIPNTSPILFTNYSSAYMKWVQLLDFLRRPLSDGGLTVHPFLLMLFGAMAVKQPKKMWVMENAGAEGTFSLP